MGARNSKRGNSLKTIQANAPEAVSIENLEATLQKAGIKNLELVPKINGIYWLRIEKGFQAAVCEAGIILHIDKITVTIKGYHSLLPQVEEKTIKSLFLKPIR